MEVRIPNQLQLVLCVLAPAGSEGLELITSIAGTTTTGRHCRAGATRWGSNARCHFDLDKLFQRTLMLYNRTIKVYTASSSNVTLLFEH